MITLERGAAVVATRLDGTAGALRDHFERHNWVLVPGFLGPRLLEEVHEELARAEFEARADEMGGELMLGARSPLVRRVLFILNDHALHRAIEAVTGSPRLVRFDGRIYRRAASIDHYHVWHTDVVGQTRLVAMSLNLSEGPYEGGVFQMRPRGGTEVETRAHNTGPGDALLFRVHPSLEHCMTDVTAGTKTAVAGWFGATPPWPRALTAAAAPG